MKMLCVATAIVLVCPGLFAAPSPQLTGEIRTYHQVGDKIKGEYSRLHPDGSVTKTWAFGDTKNGLQYKTYQMDPLGNVKSISTPQTQQPQQINQQPQTQIADQPQATPAQNPAQNTPPGVNWFLQQPMMSPLGADPFSVPDPQTVQDPMLNPFINNPFAAPAATNPVLGATNPLLAATNPLLGTNNPFLNFWNF